MRIDILSLFPEMFAPLKESIIKRAVTDEKVEINIINIRDFASAPHYKCDDEPFGGGAGMVMMCEPIYKAIESIKTDDCKIFYMSPRGKRFSQTKVREMSKLEHIILLCGHYEGVDQRVIDMFNMEEISIGDYILTGGELPAMVITDAIVRLIPNVITPDSIVEESFSNDVLEYNQYTRPSVFMGYSVPEVLLSGNHKKIAEYRKKQSIEITKKNRPDLLKEKMKYKQYYETLDLKILND